MPKWLKYSGGAAVVLAIIGAAAAPSKTKDNAGASTRPAAVAPAAAAPSAPTAPAAPTAKAPDVTVDAIKLWRDYDANEVAADGAYKGKLLQVTGTVASIDKDILGDIVVHLRSPNEFMNTRATLEKSETSKAAALNKGAHVTLQCTGKGRIVGSPSLDDCTFVE